MTDQDAARDYLRAALISKGVEMSAASAMIGRNHAYISQYVQADGTPKWLSEQDRKILVSLLGLDESKLTPPPKVPKPLVASRQSRKPRSNRDDKTKINPEGHGKFVDDPSELELLEVWDRIKAPDLRALGLTVLRALANGSSAIIA